MIIAHVLVVVVASYWAAFFTRRAIFPCLATHCFSAFHVVWAAINRAGLSNRDTFHAHISGARVFRCIACLRTSHIGAPRVRQDVSKWVGVVHLASELSIFAWLVWAGLIIRVAEFSILVIAVALIHRTH